MHTMKFLRIFLLSNEERRGLEVTFSPDATVICGRNGFGKSAILKSLYDAFGAEPHKVDRSWRDANVITAVEFMIDGKRYSILKFAGTYTVFDSNDQRIFHTASVMQELAPYLAELLDFRLLMADQRGDTVVPPPAYAFAPYYVDQDNSWSEAWVPFTKMFLPKSASALADYHLGLKPNAYYVALAERTQTQQQLKQVQVRMDGLSDAADHLRQIEPDTSVYFDLTDFKAETDLLLAEARRLQDAQTDHRSKLVELEDERALWTANISVTRGALREAETVFASAVGHSEEVQCPTCGEHYHNDITARFDMAADTEALVAAHHSALAELRAVDAALEKRRSALEEIARATERVQALLAPRGTGLDLGQVIAAEGRNAATRALRSQIEGMQQEIGMLSTRYRELSEDMRKTQDRKRAKLIRDTFASDLTRLALQLDVRVGDVRTGPISSMSFARGSEGPRGIATYFYACLNTIWKFGSGTFCPIVVDAPNQQGQDDKHLPAIIKMLLSQRPKGTQLILGVEEPLGLDGSGAEVIRVGERRNQLLREADHEAVSERLKPLLAQLV